jgi:hypothetical protein
VGDTGGVGARVFNVSMEGTQVLTNYDIYQKAGGALKAVVEQIPVTVNDGVLNISFAATVDNAKVSAIEVIQGSAPSPTPSPTPTPSPSFIEQGGQVVIEAEKYTQKIDRGGKTWANTTTPTGFVAGAVISSPNTGAQVDTNYTTTTPELQYRIKFTTTGTYYVWLRAEADSQQDNAVHVGLNGQALTTSDRMTLSKLGSWQWTRETMDGNQVATINIPSAGVYTLNIWMREDGMRLDRLLLTTNSALTPSGTGPAESTFASNTFILDNPMLLSTSGQMTLAFNEQRVPTELPGLFESDALKAINVVAWNRNLKLFPTSIRQKP